ncbi:Uncharacterized protein HZ326_10929 [Fusarium oxysporum f. sp. albedinis]|nr:Uncharacterized protein HZ326_10929 [Fusarium oxysporum f. sp. albedinis]
MSSVFLLGRSEVFEASDVEQGSKLSVSMNDECIDQFRLAVVVGHSPPSLPFLHLHLASSNTRVRKSTIITAVRFIGHRIITLNIARLLR